MSERLRLLQTIQILPLQVLDDRHLRRLLLRHSLHDRRDRRLPRQLRRPQPPLAQNQHIAPVHSRTHHNRLQHSLHLDRPRQLLQQIVIKIRTSLMRITLDRIQRQLQHRQPLRRPSSRHRLQIHHASLRRNRRLARAPDRSAGALAGCREITLLSHSVGRRRVGGRPILSRTLRKGGVVRRHHPWPRQQRLQSAPQRPPLLNRLLRYLLNANLLCWYRHSSVISVEFLSRTRKPISSVYLCAPCG